MPPRPRPRHPASQRTGGQRGVERLQARLLLAQHGVAAGDVVLGDAVDLGDAGEVVAQVVLGLQGKHVLKVNQRLESRGRGVRREG